MELVSLFSLAVLTALVLPTMAMASPSPHATSSSFHMASTTCLTVPSATATAKNTTEHVVVLNSTDTSAHTVLQRIGMNASHAAVKYTFNNPAFTGFVAQLHDDHAASLNAMSEVACVEHAVKVTARRAVPDANSQPNLGVALPAWTRSGSPWNLQRISSQSTVAGDPSKLAFTFSFPPNDPLGAAVDMYIVDSGINTDNVAFGKRAVFGFSAWGNANQTDLDGHGTHVAGTAGSIPFGIAGSSNLVAVKVLDAQGSGSTSALLAGLNYVANQHASKQSQSGFAGSVVNLSLSIGAVSDALNTALLSLSRMGIHMSVAAGNSGTDACGATPGMLGGNNSNIVSVGSIGQSDAVSSFSNTGSCVDVFAPGENVLSAWIGGTAMMNSLSGTSMASPHVAGMLAAVVSADRSLALDPARAKSQLLGLVVQGVGGQKQGVLNDGVRDGTGTLGILRREGEGAAWVMSDDPSVVVV